MALQSTRHANRARLGGTPVLREGLLTDNGNVILDVKGCRLPIQKGLEAQINQITGVVTNGLFAVRPANACLFGTADGVRRINSDRQPGARHIYAGRAPGVLGMLGAARARPDELDRARRQLALPRLIGRPPLATATPCDV